MSETLERTVICAGPECSRNAAKKNLCGAHYLQQYQGKALAPLQLRSVTSWEPQFCEVTGCERFKHGKTYCATHYTQARKGLTLRPLAALPQPFCVFPECGRPRTRQGGLCDSHDAQRRRGVELYPIGLESDPSWFKNSNGYLQRQDTVRGTLLQHREVMSEALGRPLREGENVHHINGVKDDNRLENLELWSTSQPSGQRIEDKTAWAVEWLKQYAPETLKAVGE